MSNLARKLFGKNKNDSQPEQANAADLSDKAVGSDNIINQPNSSNGDTNNSDIGVPPTGEASPPNVTTLNFNQMGSGVDNVNSTDLATSLDRDGENVSNNNNGVENANNNSVTDENSSKTGNLGTGSAYGPALNVGSQFAGKRSGPPLRDDRNKSLALDGQGSDPSFLRLGSSRDGEGEDRKDGSQGMGFQQETLGSDGGDSFSSTQPRSLLEVHSPHRIVAIPLPSQCSEAFGSDDPHHSSQVYADKNSKKGSAWCPPPFSGNLFEPESDFKTWAERMEALEGKPSRNFRFAKQDRIFISKEFFEAQGDTE
jgi:hypothetical protein